jgi:hypothetical protein
MIFEQKDCVVFTDLVDGRISLSTSLSNIGDHEEIALRYSDLDAQYDTDNEVSIFFNFTPMSILDTLIDGRKRWTTCEFDKEDKPIFDAMRRELAEMIERIDAMEFA